VKEDDYNVATLIERICENAGHTVFMTLSGEEGLAIFNRERTDLIICDLGMPGMTGWIVGKAVRQICQESGITKPPFVLLTGWGGQELKKEKIAESGTDAVLAKPISPVALASAIQEIAGRFGIGTHNAQDSG
jgi:CheY-like chemotaxis protein